MSAPLIIDASVRDRLARLRQFASLHPIEMEKVVKEIATPEGLAAHLEHMSTQTTEIPGPWPFYVTFSIETGHPVGTCRHLSMSISRKGRTPSLAAVWMIAEELGFSGGLQACTIWPEDTRDGGNAVNVVQPISVQAEARA